MTESTNEPSDLPHGDLVSSALGTTWALLASALSVGWARQSEAVHTLVTGVPIPTLNGVWAVGSRIDGLAVQVGLDAVAREGVPFCLQSRPFWAGDAARIASARGMVAQPDIPLMATSKPIAVSPVDKLDVRALSGREASLHCEVAGPAFGAPPELFAQIITPEVCDLGEVRMYVGEVNDEPVVTAISITMGQAVGIFNVATLEHHRRRGYGAALTAHAVNEAMRDGAAWAWLQSSDAGYGVYEQLGFSTIERWPCWISAG